MLVGYARVSKADGSQVTDLQRDALLAAGVLSNHIYEDAASGKRDDRPGLAACLKALRKNDTLVVLKLDRLGRDLRHLINTVHDLTGRGIGFKVLTGHGVSVDTTTASGKLVFGFFAALAEFEREHLIERTRAGLAAARARGRSGGRLHKMSAAKLRLAMVNPKPRSTTCAPNSESHARRCIHNFLTIAFEAHHVERGHHRRYEIMIGRGLFDAWAVAIPLSPHRSRRTGTPIRITRSRGNERGYLQLFAPSLVCSQEDRMLLSRRIL